MKSFRILMLGIGALAVVQTSFAQDVSYSGSAQLVTQTSAAQLVIDGPAASALYQTLLLKAGAVVAECGNVISVTLSPMICVKALDGSATCYTGVGAGDVGFFVPDVCAKPKQSIIGVGSIRTFEDDSELSVPDVEIDLKDMFSNRPTAGGMPGKSKLERCLLAP